MRVTASEVIASFCDETGLTFEDMASEKKDYRLSHPRQRLYYEIYRKCHHISLPRIGEILGGRDHTTVLYGVREHCRRVGEDYSQITRERAANQARWSSKLDAPLPPKPRRKAKAKIERKPKVQPDNPIFLDLYRSGIRQEDIMIQMGITERCLRRLVADGKKAGLIEGRAPARRIKAPFPIKEALALREQGKTFEQIAKELRVGKDRVSEQLKAAGVKVDQRINYKHSELDAIIRKNYYIMSATEIGRLAGVSRNTVIGRANRLGMAKVTQNRLTEEEMDKIRSMWSSNTVRDISNALGRSWASVSKYANRMGLSKKPNPVQIRPVPKAAKPVENVAVIPDHAKPHMERQRDECAYLYGVRYNYHACCKPRFKETPYCESHAAACYDYKAKAA